MKALCMKYLMNKLFKYSLLIGLVVVLYSCNDDVTNAHVVVNLTDSPGDVTAVNVDVQGVEVHRSSGNQESGWLAFNNVNAKVYNLLDFTNGDFVELVNTDFPTGQISQMRLILGENNSVVIDNTEIPLGTPSALQSGLKFLINETLLEGITYIFFLDFDAARSVVKAGSSGAFNLKPVIRVKTEATSGAISGEVVPAELNVAVYAMVGEDTVGTSYATETFTEFLIGALPEDTYNVVFDPGEMSGFQSTTVANVVVQLGEVTDIGGIILLP